MPTITEQRQALLDNAHDVVDAAKADGDRPLTDAEQAKVDVVARGAFAGTIERWKASGRILPGLFGHRLDDPDFYVAGPRIWARTTTGGG